MRYAFVISAASFFLSLLASPVFAGDQSTQDLLASWQQERDRAAYELVRGWLVGESPERLRALASAIVSIEARILVVTPPAEAPARALLWGRRVTSQSLAPTLLERLYEVNLDPSQALVNRPFILYPKPKADERARQ